MTSSAPIIQKFQKWNEVFLHAFAQGGAQGRRVNNAKEEEYMWHFQQDCLPSLL